MTEEQAIALVRAHVSAWRADVAEVGWIAESTEDEAYWFVAYRPGDRPVYGGTVFYVDRASGEVYQTSGSFPPRLQLEDVEKQKQEREGS